MEAKELIGLVATKYIRKKLEDNSNEKGTSRFILVGLSDSHIVQICKSILNEYDLSQAIDIKIPRDSVNGIELPENVLTDNRSTFWRHQHIEKRAILLVNTADDQDQSLREIQTIGTRELKSQTKIWADIVAKFLSLTGTQEKHIEKAIKGLEQCSDWSLTQFSEYIVKVANKIKSDGMPLINALGWALPVIQIPRDSFFFNSIKDDQLNTVKAWSKKYKELVEKRRCYLFKRNPNYQIIEETTLRDSFEKVKDTISSEYHGIVEDFIRAKADRPDDKEIQPFAELEWELDYISSLFSTIKDKKVELGKETYNFFYGEYSDLLTENEEHYLKDLSNRSTKVAVDEDKEFYEKYHYYLENKPSLKSRWDKFIYGQPIECTDFLVGLLEAIERLFIQCDFKEGKKELIIETARKKWSLLNTDIGLYFLTKYRGLDQLTGDRIIWKTGRLFEFDKFVEEKNYKTNPSNSNEAKQIKFNIHLKITDQFGVIRENKIQLIWKSTIELIGLKLRDDLKRIAKKIPFPKCTVCRNHINEKGRIQMVSLSDVNTLESSSNQDRGRFVADSSKYSNEEKLDALFKKRLNDALENSYIDSNAYELIKESWENFSLQYQQSINDWLEKGIHEDSLLKQCNSYEKLLTNLIQFAPDDLSRVQLWNPVMNLGNVMVEGSKPMSIVTPWHPMRLASSAIKARQVVEFIERLLSDDEEVKFGDSRFLFDTLREEIQHPFYPEVCIGYLNNQPYLLTVSETVNDYSLMELPIRVVDDYESNEDPKEASEKVLSIIQHYIDLQPHERNNLSIVLYNCDSTRLPENVINKLHSLYNYEDEVRCKVILVHKDMEKLNNLYTKLIENTHSDPDMFVASEVSQDFMARLSIGVMQDLPINKKEGKPADIVFLNNVISRRAKDDWISRENTEDVDLTKHIPPRYTRRKYAEKNELKSTIYLACPVQPSVGRAYLQFVYGIKTSKEINLNMEYTPVCQISFQDQETSHIFRNSHQIGEWVVNYDDLLERRHLKNQGVQVIKYQQGRSRGSNLLVSSNSEMYLLKSLVRSRIDDLNLSLSNEEKDRLVEKFISDARDISGDIVLRAAKHGVFAGELIGVVLSQALLRTEFDTDFPCWYFLDEYASWLGQKEGKIADIMCIAPVQGENGRFLKVLISESKYVRANNMSTAKKESQKQLHETVERLNNALFQLPPRLDVDLWLARISDLLAAGMELPSKSSFDIEDWRKGIREGSIPIELKGYSHIFLSTQAGSFHDNEVIELYKANNCYQEVFNRDDVRELVLAYSRGESLLGVREKSKYQRPWSLSSPKHPTSFNNVIPLNTTRQVDLVNTDLYKETATGIVDEYDEKCNVNDSKQLEKVDKVIIPGDLKPTIHSEVMTNPMISSIGGNGMSFNKDESEEKWLSEVNRKLKTALMSYNLQANILGSRLTPNAGIFRLKGTDLLTVGSIEKKRSELLTTHALEIINLTAQPGEIVVSIARPERKTISLYDVWNKRKLNKDESNLNMSFTVGVKEVDGELLYLNLGGAFEGLQQHAPHTLIAGATGSGKSILLQNLILDICITNHKDMASIYLIDPKFGVDYQMLEDLPHLVDGIIINQDNAITRLEWLVEEMDRRYLEFRKQKVSNLRDYNKRVTDNEKMPLLFLIHDEFAEWMLIESYKKRVLESVQRLGVKARAAGIHLIFAAQRPDANVLPLQLRENLGNRLILRVESIGTSEIALGEKGAEKLLGRGHMVARLSGETGLIYAQVPFLTDDELIRLTDQIKANS